MRIIYSIPFWAFFAIGITVAQEPAPEAGLLETATEIEPVEEPIEPIDFDKVVLPEYIFSELKDIIYQMPDRAPSAQIARDRLSEAQGLRILDRSAQLPRLNGFAQYNIQTEQRESGTTKTGPEFFWSINASQPVYQWGAIEARTEIGDLRMSSARIRNRGTYTDLVGEVRDLYLRIFQRKVSIQLAEEWLQIAEEDLAKMRSDEQGGTATALSLIEAEVRVRQNQADILQQEQDLSFLEQRLRALSGWTGPIMSNYQHAMRSFLETPVVDEEPPSHGDPTNSNTYQSIQNNIEIEERNYTIARSRTLPQFSVVAGIFQDQIDSAFLATSEERINYFVGGLVTWSLFDGYASTGEKMAVLARKRQLEREANLEVDLYRADFARIQSNLSIARRSIEISTQLLDLSEARFESATRQRENGAISQSELLYAKLGFNQSQLSFIESKIGYLNVLGEYMLLTGQDPSLERMNLKVQPTELPAVLNPWESYN